MLKSFVSCRIRPYLIRVLLSLPRLSTLEKIKNQERREKRKRKNYLKMITGDNVSIYLYILPLYNFVYSYIEKD